MDHVRIDDGVKRGPRIKPAKLPKVKIKPSQLENEIRQRARDSKGSFIAVHTPEKRQAVIADALDMLRAGLTTNDIGEKYGVTGQAVRTWLIASGDEAVQARRQFLSQIQVMFADQISTAEDPLALARARESFSAWHKIAQVRDAAYFGPKQEVHHSGTVTVSDALQSISERRLARADQPQVIDVTPEGSDVAMRESDR